MLGQVKRFGELVSSNVEALIDKASDPRKMLLLLRAEIEDSLLKLTRAKSKAAQQAEALAAQAKRKAGEAEEWTARAKLAMDKRREDLARSALLARESDRKTAKSLQDQSAEAKAEVAEIQATISELEARRAETQEKLDAIPAPAAKPLAGARANVADSQRSRIADMEMRTGFSSDHASETVDPTQVEAEFVEMQRDSAIEAELAAMRAPKPKASGRKTAKK